MTLPWRVLLVDDHALVRRGLAALIATDPQYEVVGEASDGTEALSAIRTLEPDVMILDMSMPNLNGLDTLRSLQARPCRARILVLSMYTEERFVAQAMELGAKGYVLKQALDHELFRALEALRRGGTYVSGAIDMGRVREHATERADGLTGRELEVLRLIADGVTTPALADKLGISPHTATRHRANLMRKLGVHNQVELLRRSRELGLVMFDG